MCVRQSIFLSHPTEISIPSYFLLEVLKSVENTKYTDTDTDLSSTHSGVYPPVSLHKVWPASPSLRAPSDGFLAHWIQNIGQK